MSAAFTPGPWWVEAVGPLAINSEPHNIAHANFVNGEANARLIASAPDLYDALKAFNIKERDIVRGTADSLTLRVSLDTIRKAAAAISKAEGQK